MSTTTIPPFQWKVEGLSVSISISRGVLSRLRTALDAAGVDEEFGGILLGRISKTEDGFETVVDSFEPFTIEHRHGSSYTLSPRDQQFLEKRLLWLRRKRLVPVGLYRNHQRRGLYLDQRDFELFQADFRHPASVFLLLRRDEVEGAKGAFFVWEEDDIRRHTGYLEFPVESTPMSDFPDPLPLPAPRRQLFAREPKPIVPKPQPAAAPSLPEPVKGAVPAKSRTLPWESWRIHEVVALSRQLPPTSAPGKVLLTLLMPILAFWSAHAIALHQVHRAQVRQAEFAAQPVPAPVPAPEVTHEVAGAPAEKPGPFEVPPVSAAPQPPAPLLARLDPPKETTPVPLLPGKGNPALVTGTRDRTATDAERPKLLARPIVRPIDSIPHATPALPDPPAVEPLLATASMPRMVASPGPATSARTSNVVAYFKPAPLSSMKQAMQRVPLIRSLTGNNLPDGFVAANPYEHPLPTLPADRSRIKDGTEVEMVASVDSQGNVSTVKLVGGNRKLADASAEALLRWRFRPAKLNGAPIESAMRVRFEFHPNQ